MALDLPEDARERVVRWRDAALDGRRDMRAVPPAALHVTLAFLGSRPASDVDTIARAVSGALDGLAPARLRAGGVVGVPRRRPRLFALDLEDLGGHAGAAQAAVSEALSAARVYRPERRPFWPHVTIARVRSDERTEPLAAGGLPAAAFEATRVTLYRSLLSPHGARYEALAHSCLST